MGDNIAEDEDSISFAPEPFMEDLQVWMSEATAEAKALEAFDEVFLLVHNQFIDIECDEELLVFVPEPSMGDKIAEKIHRCGYLRWPQRPRHWKNAKKCPPFARPNHRYRAPS